MNLNFLDFSIVAVIILSLIVSFFRGFLREVLSLVIWTVSILLSLKFSKMIQNFMQPWIHSEVIRFLITFLILFVTILITSSFINFFLKRAILFLGVCFLDRSIGIIFGTVRGILLVTIMISFLNTTNFQKSEFTNKSILAPRFLLFFKWVSYSLPKKVKATLNWENLTFANNQSSSE